MMNAGSLPGRGRELNRGYVPNPPLRRLSFAAVSFLCLVISVGLLYKIALLHFAIGSWVFLNVPNFDPRLDRNLEEIALILLQVIGGVSFSIGFWAAQNLRRSLKWSPLFIVGFALLTWVAAWAITPWQFFSAVSR